MLAPEPLAMPERKHVLRRLGAMPWVIMLGRCLVGGMFMLAGVSKLLLAPAEVVALVQQYQVIPRSLAPGIAALLPWLELGSGTALLLGVFTSTAAWLLLLQLLGFIGLMIVVIALGVPIEDCGCFGNLGWKETPWQVLIRDLVLLACLLPVLLRQRDVWGFDAWSTPLEGS